MSIEKKKDFVLMLKTINLYNNIVYYIFIKIANILIFFWVNVII